MVSQIAANIAEDVAMKHPVWYRCPVCIAAMCGILACIAFVTWTIATTI